MKIQQSLAPRQGLIASIVIFILSYLLAFSLAFSTRSWLFHFEAIYLPNLFSSVLGLINLICDLAIYSFLGINVHVIISLVLAMLSILCWTFCSLLVFRKIHITKKTDGVHRREGTPSTKTFTMPETELQRQQLLRLLLSQEDNQNADSPDRGPEATYKIQWPGSTAAHTRRNTMSTIRNNMPFHRFGSRRSSLHHHNRSHSGNSNVTHQMQHQYQQEPLTGGIERVMPDVIVEEPTMTSHDTNQSSHSDLQPAPLRPHGSIPELQHSQIHNPLLPAFFDHHPGERVPSYAPRSSSHYTQGTYMTAGTPNLGGSGGPPPLGSHGYPIEKPESRNQAGPRPQFQAGRSRTMDNYTVVEDEEAIRQRMESFSVSGDERSRSRPHYELEDQGANGRRFRSELQGDTWGRL